MNVHAHQACTHIRKVCNPYEYEVSASALYSVASLILSLHGQQCTTRSNTQIFHIDPAPDFACSAPECMFSIIFRCVHPTPSIATFAQYPDYTLARAVSHSPAFSRLGNCRVSTTSSASVSTGVCVACPMMYYCRTRKSP